MNHMPAAHVLARHAITIRHEALPARVVEKARHCLLDAAGCAIFGRTLPWSRIVIEHLRETASSGPCVIPGEPDISLAAPQAALALGVLAHAFELDSLRKPGAGVHPGATVALPALALGDAVGADPAQLVEAIVAGCEVMFRIGAATLHTPEKTGFHAPGLTGPFGAAVAAGRLLRLDENQMAHALGIAGSMGGGLLAFAASGQGGMVKRLHLGRAAEAGVTAALLAKRGFEGPHSVLEGPFGLLHAYCEDFDAALLTEGLGERFEIENICFKRYACHITAHAPVQRLRDWMAEERFSAGDIEAIDLAVSDKILSHHAETKPRDLMMVQYSVPYTLAVAAHRDPGDPRSFTEDILVDPAIADLAGRIRMAPRGRAKGWGVEMRVLLRDGTVLQAAQETFRGSPEDPAGGEEIIAKFRMLSKDLPENDRFLSRLGWLLAPSRT